MPDSTPKIALVHDWLNGFAGAEQVLLALHRIYPEAPIYTSVYNRQRTPQFAEATVHASFLQRIPGFSRRHQFLIPLMPQAFESFDLKGYDVVISAGALAKGAITQPGQAHISYCHTPIRYAWKLSGDSRNVGRMDSSLRAWAEHRLRIWDVVSAQRPDHLIANSKNIQDRIAKIYRRDSEVIYPPVDTSRFELSREELGNYFLSVGRLVEYKRIDLLIQACILAKQPLKVVGEGPERSRLQALAKDAPWIEFLGHMPDAELRKLYGQAKAFLFAAEEDFGIVPVEAMAVGRPVIAYGRGGALESVAEGVTGKFFLEQTPEGLAEVLADFRATDFDPEEARKQALKFSLPVFEKAIRSTVSSSLSA